MTKEELETAALIRRQRSIDARKRWVERQRAKDPEAFDAHVRAKNRASYQRNSENILSAVRKTRAETREPKRFHCDCCDAAFLCNAELNNHNATEAHRDRAAGIPKPAPGKYVAAEAQKRAEAVRNKTYHCSLCEKTCVTKTNLNIHFATAKHRKMAEAAGVPAIPEEPVCADAPHRSKMAAYDAKRAAEAVLTKKFHCDVWDKGEPHQSPQNRIARKKGQGGGGACAGAAGSYEEAPSVRGGHFAGRSRGRGLTQRLTTKSRNFFAEFFSFRVKLRHHNENLISGYRRARNSFVRRATRPLVRRRLSRGTLTR